MISGDANFAPVISFISVGLMPFGTRAVSLASKKQLSVGGGL